MSFNVTGLGTYTKPNQDQLLTRALFSAKSISMATPMIDVKSTQQVNVVDTDAVFQADSCGFNASGTTTFSNRTLTVGAIKVQEAWCPKDLNAKYLQLKLKAGSKDDQIPFEQVIAEQKAGIIAEQLETAFWQGDTSSSNGNLSKFDGLIKIIGAASGVVEANVSGYMSGAPYSASGGITTSNVIAIMQGIFRAIPIATLKNSVIFCGADVFRTWVVALTNANLFHYTTDSSVANMELMIPGTTTKVCGVNGLNGTYKIYAIQPTNMFFGTDMLGEENNYEIFYAREAKEVRFDVTFKAGTQIAFPSQIVKFTLS